MGIKAQSLVLLCSLSFCGDFSNGMDEDMVAVFFEPVQGFIVIGCQSVKRREGLSARSYLGSFHDDFLSIKSEIFRFGKVRKSG